MKTLYTILGCLLILFLFAACGKESRKEQHELRVTADKTSKQSVEDAPALKIIKNYYALLNEKKIKQAYEISKQNVPFETFNSWYKGLISIKAYRFSKQDDGSYLFTVDMQEKETSAAKAERIIYYKFTVDMSVSGGRIKDSTVETVAKRSTEIIKPGNTYYIKYLEGAVVFNDLETLNYLYTIDYTMKVNVLEKKGNYCKISFIHSGEEKQGWVFSQDLSSEIEKYDINGTKNINKIPRYLVMIPLAQEDDYKYFQTDEYKESIDDGCGPCPDMEIEELNFTPVKESRYGCPVVSIEDNNPGDTGEYIYIYEILESDLPGNLTCKANITSGLGTPSVKRLYDVVLNFYFSDDFQNLEIDAADNGEELLLTDFGFLDNKFIRVH